MHLFHLVQSVDVGEDKSHLFMTVKSIKQQKYQTVRSIGYQK